MPRSRASRRLRGSRRAKEFSLQLNSLIDVFTILLVFLLKSYSTEGHLIHMAEAIRLPVSTAEASVHPAVTVAFNGESLFVDNRPIVEDVTPYLLSEDLLIRPLYEELRARADRTKEIAALNPSVIFTGEVILMGDREIPFRLLKRVIYTAGQAEYVNQTLAVFREE